MEYKHTLNLPQTDFPIRANLAQLEPELLERWEKEDVYHKILEKNGLLLSGLSEDNILVEFIEISEHKFFIATQSHPELKSSLENPAPLFYGFVKACLD